MDVTQCIASRIPETVMLCRNILKLILDPLLEGRNIRSLRMETAKRSSHLNLLQLFAPAEHELASSADVESPGSPGQQMIQESVNAAAQRLLDLATSDDDNAPPASDIQRLN